MVHRPKIAGLLLAAAAVLGGCAQKAASWQKPGATQDQWTADTTYCRALARKKAQDEYSAYTPHQGSGGVQSGATFDSLMRRHDAKRNTVDIFERCLMRKGYRKAKPKADGS
ncbi:MAG: hypothetical protein OXR84_01615 [Magnetovibrio sp.]|nr:hypothetical protein [Magnetovibrio sp.]